MSTSHPTSASARHTLFMEKARRLNRTKVFVGSDKLKAANAVKEDDFRDMVERSLDAEAEKTGYCSKISNNFGAASYTPGTLERRSMELRDKFEAKIIKNHSDTVAPGENSSTLKTAMTTSHSSNDSELPSRSAREFRRIQRDINTINEEHGDATPSLTLFNRNPSSPSVVGTCGHHYSQSSDDMLRSTIDSRAAIAHTNVKGRQRVGVRNVNNQFDVAGEGGITISR